MVTELLLLGLELLDSIGLDVGEGRNLVLSRCCGERPQTAGCSGSGSGDATSQHCRVVTEMDVRAEEELESKPREADCWGYRNRGSSAAHELDAFRWTRTT